MTKYDRDEFLNRANGKARRRLFSDSMFEAHRSDVEAAEAAAMKGEPYYSERNAGGVANSYGSTTTTARCGVYIDPETMKVIEAVDRVTVSGRSVKCVYYGGESGYNRAWQNARKREVTM